MAKRSSLSIRGLAQVFKQIDENKNKSLDISELEGGLRLIGVNLNEEQCAALLKYFDKDGSNTINFNEFLVAIRVSIQIHIMLLTFIYNILGRFE